MESNLRLAGIVRESIVDGPGWRFTIFVQGCPHHCPGCHNPQTHDFSGGFDCTVEKLFREILKNPMLNGVTFSGGEPFCQAEALAALGARLREQGKNIITYSGYTLEELLELSKQKPDILRLLEITDYLIDGRFELAQRDLSLQFRGSRNQRILDAKASLRAGLPIQAEL